MNEPNDDYYDLRGAQSLSARLSSIEHQSSPRESLGDLPALARFGRSELQATSVGADPWHVVENWQSFAQQCLERMGASIAFVVDSQGLVIAAEGEAAQQFAESAGARVLVALDRAGEIDAAAGRHVCMALGQGWLTGLKAGEGQGSVTLVLRTAEPVAPRLVQACRVALLRTHSQQS